MGRKVLAEVAAVARPDTILAWYRKLVACKFDGSQVRHGVLRDCRYLLHDDTKYTQSFRTIIASGRVEPLALPARSPNLNAYAEHWVRSVKEECLSKIILFGERSLRRALCEYVEHYHAERNHQGKDNVLLFPRNSDIHREGAVQCRERLGGLLRYYHQEAA
jgi:putative transposase